MVPDAEQRLFNIVVVALEAEMQLAGRAKRENASGAEKLQHWVAAEQVVYAKAIWAALTGKQWPSERSAFSEFSKRDR